MQYTDTDPFEKDEEHCQLINSFLVPKNGPSPSLPSPSLFEDEDEHGNGSRSRRPYYHALDAADLQQLLTLYNLPLPSFVSRSLHSRNHSSHLRNNSNALSSSGSNSLRGNTRGSSFSNRNLNHLTTEYDGTRRWIRNPVWEPNPNPRYSFSHCLILSFLRRNRIRTLGMDVDSTTLEETTVTETGGGSTTVTAVLPVGVIHQKGTYHKRVVILDIDGCLF
jgi:hypothetical protein